MTRLGTLWQIAQTFGVRDGLLRLDYEAQRASGLLSRRLQSLGGWRRWDLKQIAPDVSPDDLLSARRAGAHPFFFSDSRTLSRDLRQALGADGEASLLAQAGGILAGHLPYFGRLSYACGFPPRWFENPITGQRVSPDRPWTRMRFASAPDDYGDLKFILEPSRFLFVYPLSRAYALTGDERFPEAFWTAIESWYAASPPMSGPLWICGQESSLRVLAWSFALHVFLHSPATRPHRVARLLSMITAHAGRILQTVGYARSQRSNHLVSEAVGLWTAGTLYPELFDARLWQKHGAVLLREAVLDQITPAGAYLQDSFNYQRMVLQQLLWTLRLAEIHHIDLDPEIRARTAAAFQFIAEFVDAKSGCAPNHGSNDGSYILPLAACDYADFRPLLRLASCILHQKSPLPLGPWDEPALWLCGSSSQLQTNRVPHPSSAWVGPSEITQTAQRSNQTSNQRSNQKSNQESNPASAGYHRIGTKNSWAMVRAAHYIRRPFHADQLHVDLWWRGLNLARDAGTYLYNGEPPWNNGLATTAVHNTVIVDRLDQMRRASRFLWLDWAQASGQSSSTKGADFPDYFEGEHNGYRRLGVGHRRTVQTVTEDAWFIVDDLLGEGQHEVRLHWLLPDMAFKRIADSGAARYLHTEAGLRPAHTGQGPVLEQALATPFCMAFAAENTCIRWHVFSRAPGSAEVIRAGKPLSADVVDHELLGWQSPTYGELCPAISLVYDVKSPLPVRIVTAILADDSLHLLQVEDDLLLSRDATEIYKVNLVPTQSARRNAEPSYNC